MRNAIFKSVTTRLLATVAAFCVSANAFALSNGRMAPVAEDIRPQETPLMQAFEGVTQTRPGLSLEGDKRQQDAENAAPTAEDKSAPKSDGTDANSAQAGPAAAAADQPSAEIIRDLSALPAPVKAMRERLVEAAASGDIERLRPLIEGTPKPPQIMNNESDDPIDTLKNFSGDAEGQEILAIMLDLLATGAARVDAGTPDEAYVWPYFIGKPLSELTAPERVELLRIVTAGDLMGMEETGNYNFYRLGISPDGQWKFMAGGD
ncbi:hypothetical protein JZX87_14890 [Agrobacterium sp. Ap1]|uniref:hypothetical protein n=1 Tax=Agrobacterium sp. Ap1 TaxID=2815337 RepID=UPI001A90BAD5|nr:hypothetical protein [Agrobacterium sp. Ap1]MBO0142451.1 hypothetical protein [Agrobacterium sp. Ap1]